MPHPKKNETKKEFISRCVSYPDMKEKFSDVDQRLAVCYSYWDKRLTECTSFAEYLQLCD